MVAGIFTLAGVVIGAVLSYIFTQRWQREQWLMDRRNEEFRGLLNALAESFAKYPSSVFHLQTPEMQIEQSAIRARCSTVLRDRIFIAAEVKQMDLATKWVAAMNELHQTNDLNAWMRVQDKMTEQIVKAATIRS